MDLTDFPYFKRAWVGPEMHKGHVAVNKPNMLGMCQRARSLNIILNPYS